MTETEEREYNEQLNTLIAKLDKRNEKIEYYKKKLEENSVDDLGDIDFYIEELDKMLVECRMDNELKEDILNMLEVEHFLEFGNGQNFDKEY